MPLSGEEVARLAYQAGFRGDGLVKIVGITKRESGWNPAAYNGDESTGDNSIGLAQINMIGNMGPSRMKTLQSLGVDVSTVEEARQALKDPLTNLRFAYTLSDEGTNFYHWGGYKGESDTYSTDLNEAREVVKRAGLLGDSGPVPTDEIAQFNGVGLYEDPGSPNPSGTIKTMREAEDAWYQYLYGNPGSIKVTNGLVERRDKVVKDKTKFDALTGLLEKTEDPAKKSLIQSQIDALYVEDWVPDPTGQTAYNTFKNEERLYGREKDDAKAYETQIPAVRSYLDVEQDKSGEITRQANDFAGRSRLFSELLKDEQSYSMAADDQNIQNATAMQNGTMMPNAGGWYTPLTGDNLMSSVLRPSLPDYVRPDYRMNQAVGLPGPEGFDDPDYAMGGSGGLPDPRFYDPLTGGYSGWRPDSIRGYAFGTEAAAKPDPEVAWMVGKPADFVPLNKLPKPTKPWPWGVQR